MKKIVIICGVVIVLIVGIILGVKFILPNGREVIEQNIEDNTKSEEKEVKYEVLKKKGFQSIEEATMLKAKMLVNTMKIGVITGYITSSLGNEPISVKDIEGIEKLYDLPEFKDDLIDPLGNDSDESKNYFRAFSDESNNMYIVSSESAEQVNNKIYIYASSNEE